MQSIGILAGGVAHDFNNLLLAMQGYVEISMRKLENTHPIYKNLAKIHSTISKAANLVRQLLLFSRKQPLNIISINLNTIVSNIAQMLQRMIGENITVSLDLHPDLWFIQADKSKIEQIILNLAVNARDAMPEGGILNIKTENIHISDELVSRIPNSRQGQFICLTITDSGTGIDKQTLIHIFEPFFTTKEAGKGTGLGLSVVYGIVKEHNGWINAESEVDKGTTFKIYFPAQPHATKSDKQETQALPSNLKGKKERILLIEDEEDVREVVATVLIDNDYTVIEAETASEALDIFNKEKVKFDLVLSDMILPDQNGLKLVEQLLARDPELNVILSSGYTDYSAHMPVIKEKGYFFLQKPYSIDKLLQMIKQALGRKGKKTSE
jgi:CheY-like chemotaxis protein